MLSKRIAAIAVLALLFIAPAWAAPTVSLQSNHLTLDFVESMRVWDNTVRSDVVTTVPALPWQCRWDSDTRLACSVDGATVQAATRYTVRIAPGLLTSAGIAFTATTQTVESWRPELSVSAGQWKSGQPEIEVQSNLPASSADLRAVLRVSLDGRPTPSFHVDPLPPQWKGDTRSRFKLITDLPAGPARLRVSVVPGLRTSAGKLRGIQSKTLVDVRIHEPFSVRGFQCETERGLMAVNVHARVQASCLPGEPVTLRLSRAVDAAGLRAFAAKLPAGVTVTTKNGTYQERNSNGADRSPDQALVLEASRPRTTFELPLDALVAADGARLAPVRISLRTTSLPPTLAAAHAHSLLAAAPRAPRTPLAAATNATGRLLDTVTVGEGQGRDTVDASFHTLDAPEPLASSQTTRALSEGGWARWTVRDANARSAGQLEFAAPAFDVHALHTQRAVLAWLSEWDSGAAVANAEVELLRRAPGAQAYEPVARGRSDAEGLAHIVLPPAVREVEHDDWRDERSEWLVRAVRGTRRAVLPLESTYSLGGAPAVQTWGVSDRPIYHPGDTVRYRLWRRTLDGAKWHVPASTAPLKLQLRNESHDQLIATWTAAPDAQGGTHGEQVLPVHLTDGTYCIGIARRYGETDGACFHVGTYRAQDLWAEAKTPAAVLRAGEPFPIDLAAGYFSGGPASGLDVELHAAVAATSPAEAFPAYAEFAFLDEVAEDDYADLENLGEGLKLDAHGELHLRTPVTVDAKAAPAFGRIDLSAEITPEGRDPTSAYSETTFFARFARFVGLKLEPRWPDGRTPLQFTAQVLDNAGHPLKAEVRIEVARLAGYDDDKGDVLATCTVPAGSARRCDFARDQGGWYRISAASDGAAPVVLHRYIPGADSEAANDDVEPELALLEDSPARDRPLRLQLRQQHARGRALVVVSGRGVVLDTRFVDISAPVQDLVIPVQPEWREALTVQVLVRPEGASRVDANGERTPVDVVDVEAEVKPMPAPTRSEVTLRATPARSGPGEIVRLTVRNTGRSARDVVIAVQDDALRALAGQWLPYADPGARWYDTLFRSTSSLGVADFEAWNDAPWHVRLNDSVRPQGQVAQPVPAPPDNELPIVVEDHPSPVDVPAAQVSLGGNTTLDRIQVTGSRLRQVDIETSSPVLRIDPKLAPSQRPTSRFDPRTSRPTNAFGIDGTESWIRRRFADTAFWLPDLHLEPGESRVVEVHLHDNLTRWRAVAWSSDDGARFEMTGVAIEASRPLEVRLQAPARLFPDDRSRVHANVRVNDQKEMNADVLLKVGDADEAAQAATLSLAARGQAEQHVDFIAGEPGHVDVLAAARARKASDGVLGGIEVASPWITQRRVQAGWLGDAPLELAVPTMPSGARDATLALTLGRGTAVPLHDWTGYLRDYPHRCWEQILSRAVGAAYALQRHDPAWQEQDARAAVVEALTNMAVFQDSRGAFHFFAGDDAHWGSLASTSSLTAYSVRALGWLQLRGYAVPDKVLSDARAYLQTVAASNEARPARTATMQDTARAIAASAVDPTPAVADAVSASLPILPAYVQVDAARALARAGRPEARAVVDRLLAGSVERGGARRLHTQTDGYAWMRSDTRKQCDLIALLDEHPALAPAPVRRQLRAGLLDLYAGGVDSTDTQAASTCVMALAGDAAGAKPVDVSLQVDGRDARLHLDASQEQSTWAGATGREVRVQSNEMGEDPLSVIATLAYREDVRQAQASALGLSLERQYDVLRGGAWTPVDGTTLREGDWLRVSLVVDTTAERHFVAVSDEVPGGMVPTDLELDGVSSAEVKRLSDDGNWAFATRRLDARTPRFYAEALGPGRHVVRYFARVANAGDYLAAPAVAELMYGEVTRARTAARRLVFAPAAP